VRLGTGGLALVLAAALAACGGEASGGGDEKLTVFAAASLTEVFRKLAPDARFNFAGSDELATQIREGAPADAYAAASLEYAEELHAEGLVDEPRIFATNRLVLVVPLDNPAGIERVADLRGPGVKLVIGAEGVPAGDYARTVLANLGETAVLARVVSHEDDVKGVLGKVAAGDADAGFVYATDARAAAGDVVAIELPAEAQAAIRYPVAIVAGSPRAEQARAFVRLVVGERGREALREAGFGVP
jgi:molybdate transport system substrate-binding protein